MGTGTLLTMLTILSKKSSPQMDFRVNTNRWDPILNYPGCMGMVLRLRLYLNEYLSDLHVFVSESKLNIILKSDIKKERKF